MKTAKGRVHQATAHRERKELGARGKGDPSLGQGWWESQLRNAMLPSIHQALRAGAREQAGLQGQLFHQHFQISDFWTNLFRLQRKMKKTCLRKPTPQTLRKLSGFRSNTQLWLRKQPSHQVQARADHHSWATCSGAQQDPHWDGPDTDCYPHVASKKWPLGFG